MKVIRAEVLGMCFGVRAALKTLEALDRPADVTIHGELIQNEVVLDRLKERGFHMTGEDRRVELPLTREVLVTAHGISRRERGRLQEGGKALIDTTCPLVTLAHQAAQELDAEGRFILLIGRRGHVEVQGVIEDLDRFEVVQGPEEVRSYPFPRLGVLCQTTVPASLVRAVREAIEKNNPMADVRFIDTVCQPTRDHQRALEKLLSRVPAVVVVGGRHSNNTRALVWRCREAGLPAYHVQAAEDLRPEWFAGLDRVGLTAGTSTLDETVDAVEAELRAMGVEKEIASF